jgi:hypothetical protein
MRLLSVADATVAMNQSKRYRYPTAADEAERLAETKEQFLRRTIRWTLEEFARLHRVISITQLCRVSSLRHSDFLEYRGYIIEVAAELGLLFHPQCVLALSHKNSNDVSVLTNMPTPIEESTLDRSSSEST